MGSGGGASSGSKRAAQTQASIVRDLFKMTEKGRGLGLQQNLDMLRTGGFGGSLPPVLQSLIGGGESGQKTATDQAIDSSNKAGIDSRMTGGLVNQLTQTGGATTAGARNQYVREAIGKAPELSVQPVQLATQGLSGLVHRGAAEDIAKGQRQAQTQATAGAAAGAIAAAVIGAILLA